MALKELTDRQLAELYFSLLRQYKACTRENKNPEVTLNELAYGLMYALRSPDGVLINLNQGAHTEVYKIFFAFCSATQKLPINQYGTEIPVQCLTQVNPKYLSYYQSNNKLAFNWSAMNQLMPEPDDSECAHHDESKKPEYLLVLLLAAVSFGFVFVALYYLLRENIDCFERFFFHEGWMQATVTLLSTAATTAASLFLVHTFASAPLFALAAAVGIVNPLVPLGIVICLGVVGGALLQMAFKCMQNYIIKKSNQDDALDPQDPGRFALTHNEVINLVSNNRNPINVKCAIVALRAEMGNGPVPSLFDRFFDKKSKIGDNLSKIRALRRGDVEEITVGGMYFNCRDDLNNISSATTLGLRLEEAYGYRQQSNRDQPPPYTSYQPYIPLEEKLGV